MYPLAKEMLGFDMSMKLPTTSDHAGESVKDTASSKSPHVTVDQVVGKISCTHMFMYPLLK